MRAKESFDGADEAFYEISLPIECPVKEISELFSIAAALTSFANRSYAPYALIAQVCVKGFAIEPLIHQDKLWENWAVLN